MCVILFPQLPHAWGGYGRAVSHPIHCVGCNRGVTGGATTPPIGGYGFVHGVLGVLGWRTYIWFRAWISQMVLGMMVFCPWYFADMVKGTMVMF